MEGIISVVGVSVVILCGVTILFVSTPIVSAATNNGDVVINEIMWMGSVGNSNDEWIELRNMTDADINLSGWKIDGAGSEPAQLL